MRKNGTDELRRLAQQAPPRLLVLARQSLESSVLSVICFWMYALVDHWIQIQIDLKSIYISHFVLAHVELLMKSSWKMS